MSEQFIDDLARAVSALDHRVSEVTDLLASGGAARGGVQAILAEALEKDKAALARLKEALPEDKR